VFSPGPPVSFTNKIDRHDITEILLKMALNTIKLNLELLRQYGIFCFSFFLSVDNTLIIMILPLYF
jgi:hypothetical protein